MIPAKIPNKYKDTYNTNSRENNITVKIYMEQIQPTWYFHFYILYRKIYEIKMFCEGKIMLRKKMMIKIVFLF